MSDKIEVEIGDGVFPLEVKRCYLPVKVTQNCPECGREVVLDLSVHYLSYPSLGVSEGTGMWCNGCNHEWKLYIKLGLTVEVSEGE